MFKEWLRNWLLPKEVLDKYIRNVVVDEVKYCGNIHPPLRIALLEIFDQKSLDSTDRNLRCAAENTQNRIENATAKVLRERECNIELAGIRAVNELISSEAFIDAIISKIKKKQLY